jgi:hypothetical protein
MCLARPLLAAALLAATGAAQAALIFTNTTPITISDGPSGPASPYPSGIVVSGAGTSLDRVTVDFFGLGHTYPSDIYAVLEGPTGVAVVLMANAGDNAGILAVALTFDDAASGPLPDG